jgi:peptidoglycan hydrolase-like protein with peptidoglycan-binding domain
VKRLALLLTGILAFSASFLRADEMIRRVQEELRKRNVYFGEIDGRQSEELGRALRRYQERKGLPVSGESCVDTLSALNLGGRSALAPAAADSGAAQAWPDVPVLKSDVPRLVKEEDRKFLESLDAIAEPPDEPALPPPSPAAGAEPGTRPVPGGATAPSPASASASELAPEKLQAFVRDYLKVCEGNMVKEETQYYADRVDYFDHGSVDRRFIERDVAAFYKRWPKRKYDLIGFDVVQSDPDKALVRFRIGFAYHNTRHRVAGQTDNFFTVQKVDGRLAFIAMKEKRIRN